MVGEGVKSESKYRFWRRKGSERREACPTELKAAQETNKMLLSRWILIFVRGRPSFREQVIYYQAIRILD